MTKNYEEFAKKCKEFMFDDLYGKIYYRVYDNFLQRFAYGVEASCYRYIPEVVVKPINEEEVQKIINLANFYSLPLTFKGSGTSLSGQVSCESILVLTTQYFNNIDANKDSVRLDCGVLGVDANNALKPYNKKIGPDPATINSASIGGIFSNNSSGMCCGVKQNSYQTVKSVRVILPDGSILDTSDESSVENFVKRHQDISDGLLELHRQIKSDEFLSKEITRKYKIKNTTGYSLNALLDFESVKDILTHIFIGAEGTLGFVSSVEYFTVDDFIYKSCALIFYQDLNTASDAIKIMVENDDILSSAELMDYYCLVASRYIPSMPEEVHKVTEGNCCILIQLESNNLETLSKNLDTIKKKLSKVPCLFKGINFSFDEQQMASWWKVRKSALPIAASTRRKGSTLITEDICFEVDNFAKGIEHISQLFKKYNLDGIIYGHVLACNVHFNIAPILSDEKERNNFAAFMDEMVHMVVSLKGSTKAEHGTGRMVAPFVELEWGEKAYNIHKKIKELFDPKKLINPDVIICDNKEIHMQKLKPANSIEDFLTACMECGFCEKACPSRNITLTPRQRIAIYREISRLETIKNRTEKEEYELKELKGGFKYMGIDTCASCSMCQTLCPIEIDTAKLGIKISNNLSGGLGTSIAKSISSHMGATISLGKAGLSVAHFGKKVLGDDTIKRLSYTLNQKIRMPFVPEYMPYPNSYVLTSRNNHSDKSVVYFTSCMYRGFAPNKEKAKDKRALQEVFESICKKAGVNIIYPQDVENLCCGKAFKTMTQKHPDISPLSKAAEAILRASENGKWPVIVDHSACAQELTKKINEQYPDIKIMDMAVYANDYLVDRLSINKIDESIGLYSVCSVKLAGWGSKLLSLAQKLTDKEVFEDIQTYCCGFSGNKGFTLPELNNSALMNIEKFYKKHTVNRLYSTSCSCEVGLSEKTKKSWQHIMYLLDEVSSPK